MLRMIRICGLLLLVMMVTVVMVGGAPTGEEEGAQEGDEGMGVIGEIIQGEEEGDGGDEEEEVDNDQAMVSTTEHFSMINQC